MAITIDVITKVVDSSLRGSSDTIDKHFTKTGQQAGEKFSKALSDGVAKSPDLQRALDKAADATGKLRVEQEKLNAVNKNANTTDAQKIAAAERVQRAKREEARAVRDAAEAYDRANSSAGGMLSTLSSLSSGTRFGGVIAQAEQLGNKFGGIGLAAGGAIAGVAALTVAAVQAGQGLYNLGRQWDDIGDAITARTGKVGAELDAITDRISDVSTRVAMEPGKIGEIFGQTAQSLRLSGEQLELMGEQVAKLNNLTGEPTNIRQLGEVYRMFGVDAGEQISVLNNLYGVFQQTGIPVNELIATLQKAGPTLAEFGMSIEQSAAFLRVFENAGISSDAAIKGLRFALKNLAEAGVEPKDGLQQIITEIQNLIAAGDDLGARNLAEERFGKGFAEILRAIRDNRIELQALPGDIDPIKNRIDDATEATEDFAEEWQKFKNMFADTLRPAAQTFFAFLNDAMSGTTDYMTKKVGEIAAAWTGLANANWWRDSAMGRALSALGFGPGDSGEFIGGGGQFGTAGTPDAAGILPNARPLYDKLMQQFPGADIGGYRVDSFHEHDAGALDFMTTDPAQAAKVMAEAFAAGAPYVLWQQRQWNADGTSSPMQDRGDRTQNHMDHVHIAPIPVSPADTAAAGILGGAVLGVGGTAADIPATIPTTAPPSPAATPPTSRQPMVAAEPGTAGTFTPGTFPAAGDVGPASPNLSPVQMVPSPFGPQYQPVPAGSTPGYGLTGKPGYYLPDPKQVETATRGYEDSLQNVIESNKAIESAKEAQRLAAEEAAKIENDLYSSAEDRARAQARLKSANDGVDRAVKAAERANQNAEDAEQRLAEAKLGTFREAQKAAEEKKQKDAKSKGGMTELGFPLADDFGLSEGLPGVFKWLTTFMANLAFAPAIGAMSAVTGGQSPYQTGSGLFGMFGGTAGTSMYPSGFGGSGGGAGGVLGAMSAPMAGTPPGASAMGPAPLGGSLGSTLGGGLGPAPGPGKTAQTSRAPSGGPGGPGFAGLGGAPMGLIQGAIQMGSLAIDSQAPGAGQAAAAAAQIGIQLANRTAGYIGQAAAIGVGGLMETMLPNNSEMADPTKSWAGRLAAGFAGARPATPNTAGGEAPPDEKGKGSPAGESQPPQTPEEAQRQAQQQNGGGQSGPMVKVENLNNYANDGGQTVANQIGRMQMSSYASLGPR